VNILGLSAYYHDSAACLVVDGEIVAAAQEERFTRKKHDHRFPAQALTYCLAEAGIEAGQVDLVAFYDKPLLKLDRLVDTFVACWPSGFPMFTKALPLWLHQKLQLPRELDRGMNGAYRGRYLFLEHHQSHAASAFFPSPFQEAAIVTLDGVGEWTTGSIAIGRDNTLELVSELRFPHSLGLLYSAFTAFAGFKVNSGEYKLMGLAPFGEPVYRDDLLNQVLDLKDDGSFRLNMDYFSFTHREVMTSRRMETLLGGPPRAPESPITQREMDIAASIQAVAEEIVLRIGRHAHRLTGFDALCLAGGVALNCVANGRLRREGPFQHLWIQPAAGDAGGALGAATFVWYQLLENPRTARPTDSQSGSALGPAYRPSDVAAYLDGVGARYQIFPDEDQLAQRVAELIARQQVVGHCAGRMEFGPRALGARSILGDPRSPSMQRLMNLRIKARESFRPFAPAVLRERAHEYFELGPNEESPYMLLVAPVRADRRCSPAGQALAGLARVQEVRSDLPAITHVDHSARVQTVDPVRHGRLYRIIKAFERLTGCPVVINTSFNVRGEPIVQSPADAYRCFMATEIDALVIENALLLRAEQPVEARIDRQAFLARFSLD
jgi:carbamoyltransferase